MEKLTTEQELFEYFANSKLTEKVARVYAGGDNMWKGYGFEFFKSDLSAAFKNIKEVEDFFKLQRYSFDKKNTKECSIKKF